MRFLLPLHRRTSTFDHHTIMRPKFLTLLASIILPICVTPPTWGAKPIRATWDIELNSTFDNREGDDAITPTKTYFFTRLSPEIGLRFGSNSRIAGGVVWFQPIGCEWEGHRISPTLYYRYESKSWQFSMGMFPRSQMHEELPSFLWSDSLSYSQRNIRGAMVQYDHPKGYAEAYLDWRGMQTERQREAFNIVVGGKWYPSGRDHIFMLGGHLMMNHFALTKNSPSDQHIVDNFLINPYVGADFGHLTPLDSLTVRCGLVATVERNRAHNNWTTPVGGWLEIETQWKFLGLKNTFYAGGRQQPSWKEFGSLLYQGEPYYQEKLYNRTDIYVKILCRRMVQLTGSLNFNVTPGNFTFYQKLTLDVSLGGKFGK